MTLKDEVDKELKEFEGEIELNDTGLKAVNEDGESIVVQDAPFCF